MSLRVVVVAGEGKAKGRGGMGFGSSLLFARWSFVVGPVGWLPTLLLLGSVCLRAAGVFRSCLGVVFRVYIDGLSPVCRALRWLVPPPALAAAVFWAVGLGSPGCWPVVPFVAVSF